MIYHITQVLGRLFLFAFCLLPCLYALIIFEVTSHFIGDWFIPLPRNYLAVSFISVASVFFSLLQYPLLSRPTCEGNLVVSFFYETRWGVSGLVDREDTDGKPYSRALRLHTYSILRPSNKLRTGPGRTEAGDGSAGSGSGSGSGSAGSGVSHVFVDPSCSIPGLIRE